ncbi:hypothetical protein TRIUR3_11326 [Triticum urartu]|uniref:Uncharacterized protein n=1 Tax=Triticum urartu TaxID=4572 RepID=M7Z863_TRIUA|nr:hypothetical protein TRIUR3_11326 [Triticum urartu]
MASSAPPAFLPQLVQLVQPKWMYIISISATSNLKRRKYVAISQIVRRLRV